MPRLRTIARIAAALVFLATAASGRSTQVQVEMDAFSGLPNPRWDLDEKAAAALLATLAALPPTSEAPPVPPDLGYRGFHIRADRGEFLVYRGYVSIRANGRVSVLRDTAQVEEQLIAQARALGYAAIFQRQ